METIFQATTPSTALTEFKRLRKQGTSSFLPLMKSILNESTNTTIFFLLTSLLAEDDHTHVIFLDKSILDAVQNALKLQFEEIEMSSEKSIYILRTIAYLITLDNLELREEDIFDFAISCVTGHEGPRKLACLLSTTLWLRSSLVGVRLLLSSDSIARSQMDQKIHVLANTNTLSRLRIWIGVLNAANLERIVGDVKFDEAFESIKLHLLSSPDIEIQRAGIETLSKLFSVSGVFLGEVGETIITSVVAILLDRWEDNGIPSASLKDLFLAVMAPFCLDSTRVDIVLDYLYIEEDTKGKYDLLRLVASRFDSGKFLPRSPDIIVHCLSIIAKKSLKGAAGEFLIAIIKKMRKEGRNLERIIQLIKGTFEAKLMIDEQKLLREKVIPVIGEQNPSLLDILINNVDYENNVLLMLAVLLAAKLNGYTLAIGATRSKQIIVESLRSDDEEEQLVALLVVIETKKSNVQITDEELSLVKMFLLNGGGSASVERRQGLNLSGQLKRFFERVQTCLEMNTKSIKSLRQKQAIFPEKDLTADIDILLRSCKAKDDFLKSIYRHSMAALFPGAAIGRTTSRLAFLKVQREVELDRSKPIKTVPSMRDSNVLISYLISCYDKRVCADYITLMDIKVTVNEYSYLLRKASQMIESTRVNQPESGVALIAFLFQQEHNIDNIAYINVYVNILSTNITIAECDLQKSTKLHPLNGAIAAISQILTFIPDAHLEIGNLSIVIERVIELCYRAISVCSIIVTHAPEADERHCFLSVKAASICLSLIATRATSFFNPDRRFSYINLLATSYIDLLTTLRHKGTFGALEEGFSMVCCIVGAESEDRYRDLLRNWLDAFLSGISSIERTVMRKSAGIPVGVVSVIKGATSKVEKLYLLERALKVCFEVALSVQERDQTIDLPQVHAVNVLRGILLESELSKLTRDSFGDFFELNIKLFSSDCFPIRNCAGMLYSTLISKTAGTSKPKDESNFDKLIQSRAFFSRFPSLYKLLHAELEASVSLLESESSPVLFAILALLARMTGCSSGDFSTRPFELLVLKCPKAVQWKVREVSANTFAALRSSAPFQESIDLCLSSNNAIDMTCNEAHGLALQIDSLVDFREANFSEMEMTHFATSLLTLDWICNVQKYSVARAVLLKVIARVFYVARVVTKCNKVIALKKLCETTALSLLQGTLSFLHCPTFYYSTFATILLKSSEVPYSSILDLIVYDTRTIHILNGLEELDMQQYHNLEQAFKASILAVCLSKFDTSDDPELVRSIAKFFWRSEILMTNSTTIVRWLSRDKIPYSTIGALLNLLSRQLIYHPSGSLWQFTINRFNSYIDIFPYEVVLSAVQCLNEQDISASHEYFVPISVLLDRFVGDGSEQVRKVASSIISRILGLKYLQGAGRARLSFAAFVTSKSDIEKAQWAEHHLEKLIDSDARGILENFDVPVSFEADDPNGFKEPLSNFLLHSHVLMSLGFSSDRLSDFVDTSIKAYQKEGDLYWRSVTRLELFNNIAAAICCAYVVDLANRNTKRIDLFFQLKLHPMLVNLIIDRDEISNQLHGSHST